jgi:hypothetical protein
MHAVEERISKSQREAGDLGMSLRACLLIAAAAAALGLAVRLALAVPPPEPAFVARIKWWQDNAQELAKGHHIERAETPCGASFCPSLKK